MQQELGGEVGVGGKVWMVPSLQGNNEMLHVRCTHRDTTMYSFMAFGHTQPRPKPHPNPDQTTDTRSRAYFRPNSDQISDQIQTKFRQIQTNSDKLRQIQTNSDKFRPKKRENQTNSDKFRPKFRQIQTNSDPNSDKFRQFFGLNLSEFV